MILSCFKIGLASHVIFELQSLTDIGGDGI